MRSRKRRYLLLGRRLLVRRDEPADRKSLHERKWGHHGHQGNPEGVPALAGHHLDAGAVGRAEGEDRRRHGRQLLLLLQPRLPRLPQVGHRDAREPGARVGGPGLDVPGHHGAGVHRLPRADTASTAPASATRRSSRRSRISSPACRSPPRSCSTRCAARSRSSWARSRPAISSTPSSSTTAPTPSRARSSSPASTPGSRTSSPRCAAFTARAAARCRSSASGSTGSRSCRCCPASSSSSSATRTP